MIVACSSEEDMRQEADGVHVCRLVWDSGIQGFGDGTRAAAREKQDGDCVFLRFKKGNSYVEGKAVYHLSGDEWILTYNGSLTLGEASICTAYFIEGVDAEYKGTIVDITPQMLVSSDKAAEYVRESDCVRLRAHLIPETGRIRFKGASGSAFRFSGISYLTSFNTADYTTSAGREPLDLVVDSTGYTPFVYATLPAERTMSVYYDFQTYRKTDVDSHILAVGQSGYMLLPTEDSHNGWELVKVELPTLSDVTTGVISNVMASVNATITSLGNGTLLDAGFVYATTENPTLESTKVSCGATETLAATLHDLTPVTTYYIRAYATNERGTNYSEQLAIITTATPTTPTVRTGKASDIKDVSATVSGTIENLGAINEVTQHGHVWSTTPNPTDKDKRTQLGATSKVGEYRSSLTELSPNTTYYVRAYAVNNVGMSYGEQISFTTPYGEIVMTTSVVNLLYNSVSIKASVTSTGGHVISERGVCWSTAAAPSVSDNVVVSAKNENDFQVQLDGLKEKTRYYVRVYLKVENNEVIYSKEIEITTPGKDDPFVKEDYEDDENLSGDSSSSDADMDREGYEEDADWTNGSSSTGNTIGKEGYGEDENVHGSSGSAGNTVDKDGYENDENWSV